MDPAGVDNDTRGWIMCSVSGIACVAGASIICVDLVIRLIPSKRDFRIQDSNAFLACSLSLSFGVMLFSALYSMLPSAMRYLAKDDWEHQAAGFLVMGCFVAGFVGIQVISRILHQFMPSHVVDCDHTHGDFPDDSHSDLHSHHHNHSHSRASRSRRQSMRRISTHSSTAHRPNMAELHGPITESTPLLPTELDHHHEHRHSEPPLGDLAAARSEAALAHYQSHGKDGRSRAATTQSSNRRPSMMKVPSRVLSFVKDTKPNCDEFGPCFGYSDPCGQECFKHINSRSAHSSRHPTLLRTTTGTTLQHQPSAIPGVVPEDYEDDSAGSVSSPLFRTSRAQSRDPSGSRFAADDFDSHTHSTHTHTHADNHDHDHDHDHDHLDAMERGDGESAVHDDDLEAQHHHHVPTNAFLSIGLQTVIAIALHKFPEGFITYATNHASPALGFNVFMALFVHNIAEGFAMALPLYMALGSRFKAMLWSSLLGGLSQPAGAGVAVLWFKIAKRSNFFVIDETAYAVLFAVTAGIMASVALQLFVESLSLNHDRNLSILFAFLGMTLMGVSNALVNE
ncbi:Zinc/iron permease [Bombardia bombarda]|uniref:Zinc/iron permease n=1 Tax=Bombardia bombarda TaxID=252184 RepID=A0AA39XB33_9PEZI|nr:Zinc/iron permease [Bombardia bombarda]